MVYKVKLVLKGFFKRIKILCDEEFVEQMKSDLNDIEIGYVDLGNVLVDKKEIKLIEIEEIKK